MRIKVFMLIIFLGWYGYNVITLLFYITRSIYSDIYCTFSRKPIKNLEKFNQIGISTWNQVKPDNTRYFITLKQKYKKRPQIAAKFQVKLQGKV